ncbi:MAG: outer membrane lipoprotein carrier protein LolA [Deltaproteobacteria bacterium]|nr:outer membrane lipoprotein carrier protein LolA [Deltaproteobacteria bacterium]
MTNGFRVRTTRFRRLTLPLLALLLTALLLPAPAPALEAVDVVAKVQALYDKAGGFKAYFQQESRLKTATHAERAEGWVTFQKPLRMRWQYERPPDQKKEVVSDGRQVWMYLPQDKVVMIYPLKQVLRSDLVMRFFSGMGQFRQEFRISWHRAPHGSGPYLVDLVPQKPQAELKRLTLGVNPATHQVERLEFTNELGEETRFTFSRIQLNIKVAADFFTFVPPPGVQVVREGQGGR